MKQQNVVIVGHRGAHGLAPENTLAGFAKAMEYDIQQIELDVRLTRDGKLVHVHNADLVGHDGSRHRVADSTYEMLKAHKPDIATLEETIEFVNHRVQLMIEVKAGTPAEPVAAVIKSYLARGWQPSDFMFAAFDYRILKQLYKLLPEIDRVVLDTWSGMRATSRARRLKTPYISMDQDFMWWGFVRSVASRYKLYTYPYPKTRFRRFNHNKPKRWFKHGLYGAIVDYPDSFAAKVETR
jgi:glycerophosphoryl diester phosphodiesterase